MYNAIEVYKLECTVRAVLRDVKMCNSEGIFSAHRQKKSALQTIDRKNLEHKIMSIS